MSSVKVTRTVDVDKLFGKVIQDAYKRMAMYASNAAVNRAPVDRGYLKASMMYQAGDVSYSGNGVHLLAVWKPTAKKGSGKGKGPLEYGAYLNSPTGGTETIPAGPRTYPGKGKTRPGKKHGPLFGRHKGTWDWPEMTRQLSKDPKYVGTPRAGSPTRGWFNPGVVDDLHKAGTLARIAELAAAELEAGWNK